jgi:hypothetical protein
VARGEEGTGFEKGGPYVDPHNTPGYDAEPAASQVFDDSTTLLLDYEASGKVGQVGGMS